MKPKAQVHHVLTHLTNTSGLNTLTSVDWYNHICTSEYTCMNENMVHSSGTPAEVVEQIMTINTRIIQDPIQMMANVRQ